MGKNKKAKKNTPIAEEQLHIPVHSAFLASDSALEIVDTHTHLASTFAAYRSAYRDGTYADVFALVRGLYAGRAVKALVDVYCEAPVQREWRELADSAGGEAWGGVEYWFVMGVHPHAAKDYTDEVEQDILTAMAHPRCVGWGEMGLDYHYDNSPRDVQQAVFARQLRHAVRLGKSLTIHTREAEEDTERILKEIVPREHKIHIHCFTDSPEFAQRLLDYFPNLFIGITGVITYSTNLNTSAVIRNLVTPTIAPTSTPSSTTTATSIPENPVPPFQHLRILLETDAPFMVPSNVYAVLLGAGSTGKGKLPLSHTAMIPWTAEFVAGIANGISRVDGAGVEEMETEISWDAARVMRQARENARFVYGV